MCLTYGCPENFREPLSTPMAAFPEIFNGLLFRSIVWVCLQNLKFVALPVSEIIGGTKKFGQSLDTIPFLQFLMGFCADAYCEFTGQISSPYSFTRSWDNSDWSFWWGCEPQSWGSGGRRGSGMVPFERALVSSCRPSIVTFPLSLCVSEILPLLCSRTPLFPTSPLVSPKCPNAPPGVGWWRLGYEERRVGLIVHAISF